MKYTKGGEGEERKAGMGWGGTGRASRGDSAYLQGRVEQKALNDGTVALHMAKVDSISGISYIPADLTG